MKTIKFCLLLFLFSCLVGCKQLNFDRTIASDRFDNTLDNTTVANNLNTQLAEVAPPKIIKELNSSLEYFPQVEIIAPQAEQTFNRTSISVRLNVENLPVFKDDRLQLGNHLNLIIDNEPLQPIYDIEKPIIIKELTPGTHTIRVFAVRPWEESFKNEEAYDIVTFNVLTETNDNRPELDIPLLTYNSPTGTYGAEPLLLDFYLTNAPLHAIAKNNSDIKDWRIRATVNGTSFILEDWQPIYLTGIKPGENWVQLELIDETGNIIENTFNDTVRVFTYNPEQDDALARLFTDRLTLAQALASVKPNNVLSEMPETIEPVTNINETTEQTNLDAVVEPETALETMPIAVDEPTVTMTSPDESDRLAAQKLETSIFESELDIDVELGSDAENIVVKDDSVPTEPLVEEKSFVAGEETDLDREQPMTTIDFTQLKSVESREEVATIVPETKSQPKANTLWWKRILVGLRQKIEALAKTLPDEV